MSEFAARIRRVRMKGGADVHILPKPQDREGLGPVLIERSREASAEAEIVAYAVVAMYADGCFYTATNSAFGDVPMNRHAFVGMAAEAIRDQLISEETACRVFNRGMGYED